MNKTILLAVDTTSHTAAAAEMTRELASGQGDVVVVLHVHEFAVGRFGRIQVDCGDGEGEAVVAQIVSQLETAGITAHADIRKCPVGQIARTINGVAQERDATLIVLGSTTSHDVPRLPFGSVSLRLLHMASKPVLIVPKSIEVREPEAFAGAGATR